MQVAVLNRPRPGRGREARLGPLSPSALEAVAHGLSQAVDCWSRHVRYDHHERQATLVLANGRYDVWVIGWLPGQRVALHDHGGSAGALSVVEGELVEVAGSPPRSTETHRPGAVRVMPAGLIHEVANRSDRPAASVHVYSPPLRAMAFYDQAGEGPIRSEQVSSPATVGAGDPDRRLHPAGGGR